MNQQELTRQLSREEIEEVIDRRKAAIIKAIREAHAGEGSEVIAGCDTAVGLMDDVVEYERKLSALAPVEPVVEPEPIWTGVPKFFESLQLFGNQVDEGNLSRCKIPQDMVVSAYYQLMDNDLSVLPAFKELDRETQLKKALEVWKIRFWKLDRVYLAARTAATKLLERGGGPSHSGRLLSFIEGSPDRKNTSHEAVGHLELRNKAGELEVGRIKPLADKLVKAGLVTMMKIPGVSGGWTIRIKSYE
jgi:hypothetical protein